MKNLYAVIGCPVKHSKSPDIYNYLFNKYDINSHYITIELNEDNAVDFLDKYASAMNLCGINVTMPLKAVVADYAKEIDEISRKLRSVNTLDLNVNKGYTTDGKGLLLSLEYQGIDIKDKNILVLGAGGAARSVVYELREGNAGSITVLNRTVERARELSDTIGGEIAIDTLSAIDKYIADCDVLINCTSMGMGGRESMPLDFMDGMKKSAFVYDIIYEPRQTELLKRAEERGLSYCNGLDMLICQAFYAFEIYTGIMPSKKDRDMLLKML